MSPPPLSALAAVVLALSPIFLASCEPPPPVPPPRFRPNPPYPPNPVDPYRINPDGTYQQDISPPPNPNPIPTRPGEYPVAQRTANPNEVISPYEPYNVIDISEFTSGQLARDPHNQKIFRVP